MRGKNVAKIMTVDNEPSIVEMVKRMLEAKGHEVSTALSGEECLEKLKREKPDLLLLDVMMPGLSGWDAYWRIRKKDKRLKVVFMSVLEISPKRAVELGKEGVFAYITKPFTREELASVVRRALGKKV